MPDEITGTISIISLILSTISLVTTFYFSYYSYVASRQNKFCDDFIEADKIIIDNPELNCLFDSEEFERKRREDPYYSKKVAFSLMNFNMFENIYSQFLSKKTFFSKNSKIGWEKYIRLVLSKKAIRETWEMKETEEFYDEDFRKYINNLISKSIK
jgi:hypothetical protein